MRQKLLCWHDSIIATLWEKTCTGRPAFHAKLERRNFISSASADVKRANHRIIHIQHQREQQVIFSSYFPHSQPNFHYACRFRSHGSFCRGPFKDKICRKSAWHRKLQKLETCNRGLIFVYVYMGTDQWSLTRHPLPSACFEYRGRAQQSILLLLSCWWSRVPAGQQTETGTGARSRQAFLELSSLRWFDSCCVCYVCRLSEQNSRHEIKKI